jgi:hypothetical protein
MVKCLVVAQAVAQGALELGSGPKAPMMRRPSAPHLPEALHELELWTIAGPSIALQMRTLAERRRDQRAPMPGGVVDDEHDTRIVSRRRGPSDISPVPRTARLPGARPQPARLGFRLDSKPLAQAGGEPPRHQVERPTDVHQRMAVQVAHDRPLPFAAEGRPPGGDHREARVILTAHDQCPRRGVF